MSQDTTAYEILVSTPHKSTEHAAIADASRYLAYGDQSDLIGLEAEILSASPKDGYVAIEVMFPKMGNSPQKALMDSLAQLKRVESVEKISVEAWP